MRLRLPRLCRRRRTPDPPLSPEELAAMRDATEADLAEAEARDPEAREVVARHRRLREENHFGDLFLYFLEGGRDA
ncbi:hypothetical protein [Nocardiopsis sp. NPDC057823]|uniref:DUF7620 family protein n=1 Tax=Nocardiopsis sp. NPDC057823 TaxID=3346256 RepID=UPI00366B91FD